MSHRRPLDAPTRLDADGNSLITGTVDMTAYLQWLQENYLVPRSPLGWDADGKSRIAGDVNMELYAQWLKQNYGLTLDGS